MKLEAIEGLTVNIRSKHNNLDEYEDDADELYVPSIGRRYVQAGSGDAFKVHFKFKKKHLISPDKRDEINCCVYLDGQYAAGSIIRHNTHAHDYTHDTEGVHEQSAGDTFFRPFTFSALATDDRPANDSNFKAMKKLGEIKVTCTWMRTTSAPRPVPVHYGYKSVVDGSVPEKCLKGRAISQSAG
ncbi:hypothetical protein LTR86_004498 [Recurvomyces mirabilis]|nr:hypothetical protein LTR86_004498 [Recurvomyces mirabilis]